MVLEDDHKPWDYDGQSPEALPEEKRREAS